MKGLLAESVFNHIRRPGVTAHISRMKENAAAQNKKARQSLAFSL
ncbi:hypothetical protein ACIPLR_24480 [Herbaspirillum huttiense]|jgi:hypothetical protein|nr:MULTISPECIES: hypothetical protein [Herbaspirillum]MBP1318105.1 hypothetical protein [Herbaspirillum sp. 1130]MDR6743281.1 hypothetical protein [Herbaspirillum sp. 1173]MDR9851686.1 hypothetical protein [Herbaspirillum huttiense SE1]MDT0359290.1 hypothetical protein [Herbaspirillum huttiense F1]MEE1639610.1 hypothetical protein [Herbaspirillum huttiense NC40101]